MVMKKIVSLVLMSLMTLNLIARVPVESVVYLDASQAWCCKATYAVCTTESGNAARIMTPVTGIDGVYSFTVPTGMSSSGGMQDNFRFGYSMQSYNRDQPNWTGFTTYEFSGSWSAAKPYYIVTDDGGGGYWAAQPVSTGVTALDSVIVKTPTTCIDSTYDAVAYIYFNGSPCSIQVTGDQLAQAFRTTDIHNPLVVRIKEDIKENAGKGHYVAVTLYKTRNYTDEVANLQVSYTAPEIECEVEYQLGDKCANEPLTLSTDAQGDVYMWSTGESTKSIQVLPTIGEQAYTVEVYGSVLHPAENLMSNGDFETNPPTGFTSDYTYVGWDEENYYSSHAGAHDLYVITHNANYFWHDFASILPHGGEYYALFDAGSSGYAWQASTNDNPNLKVQKDSIYLFSYWAAYPNKARNNSPAILRFEIKYTDANGREYTQDLGAKDTLGREEKLNGWYQRTVSWKAPIDANYVKIGVKDLNHAAGGNDFCLDDIMFQKASITNILLSRREIFHVNGIDCGTPAPPDPPIDPDPECTDNWLRTKWTDVIFVDNSAGEFVRYQWFKNDQEIAGATEQFYHAQQRIDQSTDLYHAKMWKADGTVVISCPKAFSEISQSHLEYPYRGAAQVVERRMLVVGSHFRIVETIYDDGHVEAVKEVY